MNNVKVVQNSVQTKEAIDEFLREGFTKGEIYLLAHNKKFSEDLTDKTDTSDIGMGEQGIFHSVANVFRSRGDELRSKMQSLGLSNVDAERYEEELDEGRIVVIATKSA
ncbi:general stress protein [Metabacillus fastidiosus]|uniref:General stress protein n=1 Tax=Metabacillus fastidiosus TaxID=1458 RepID=A0ABU6NTT9_9BACI|nr:general stress protein [Metabacillus fastidiosus]MED4400564.1 general stress protein [Metabacillus fastidiosus]MED4455789.1 general stress protein [Metabacillus fastidiosus]MED4464541.1 general stress protein [Metabacillus fastidiosus]MED4534335.1 general stress protein [Metabacillus fastidiosus]